MKRLKKDDFFFSIELHLLNQPLCSVTKWKYSQMEFEAVDKIEDIFNKPAYLDLNFKIVDFWK